jgi:manganese/iron transport system substrate-binding protein
VYKSGTRRLLALLSTAVLAMAILGNCEGAAPAVTPGPETKTAEPLKPVLLSNGEKLAVVATTNIISDVVGNVGGDRIALTTLMKIGVDPHEYVPAPSDAAAIHDADVVFANGAGLEANLEEMLTSAGGSAAEIALSDGLDLHPAPAGGEGPGPFDPHVWFDVQNVIRWVETIDGTLGALDPANAEYYAGNASAYTQQLKDLDNWVIEQIAQIPADHHQLVTNHPAFGYLAGRYGLEQVGAIYPVSPSSEPSAQDIAALEDAIRKLAVPAVFTESTVSPKLAEQVAQDTGVRLISLYTGSLGGPGSGAESYIQMIRFDVNAIVEALK